jgi:histidyl-tRNA synthetase
MSIKKIQPKNPPGTRDFLPQQVVKRKYILKVIRSVFEKYGFQEIETPAMETLETLSGKYGEEGDRLLFKILNSGAYLDKVTEDTLLSKNHAMVTSKIADKGLRYDLTVPLARYVVQHQNELCFPFKRYHIGPVWRADRPQKGRYREFYQCDADVIGSTALMNEIELTHIFIEVYQTLGIEVTIQLNNRKILEGIIECVGLQHQYTEILRAIDKKDKIGEEGVAKELAQNGINPEQINALFKLFAILNLDDLKTAFQNKTEIGLKGIEEMQAILSRCYDKSVVFSPALARGLDYYTGTVWEVITSEVQMGTISAGGRYDDLTSIFGGQNMSGVGISFGIERIYDVLEELKRYPENITTTTRVLIINFDAASEAAGWSLVQLLRQAGIAAELYPESAKLKKQMSYADKKGVPYVVFIGEEELKNKNYSLKNMESGEQVSVDAATLIQKLS